VRDPRDPRDVGDLGARDGVLAIWRWRLERLQQAARTRWVSPYQLAVHEAFLGDVTGALDSLDQAYAAREGVLVFLKTDPALDPLRSHPRFNALAEQDHRKLSLRF
jgi:hypothetical protein